MARLVLGVVAAAVLAVVGWLVWSALASRPEPPKLPPLELQLAERAAAKAAVALEFPRGIDTVTPPELAGDLGPEVAKVLRARLAERDRHMVEVASLKREHPGLSRALDAIAGSGVESWASELWKQAGVHAFIRGRADFVDEGGATICRLDVRLEDSATRGTLGTAVHVEERIHRSLLDLDYYRLALARLGVGWRVLGWLVTMLALPLVAYPVLVRLLARESNAANLGAWFGLTGLDLGLALALSGFQTPGLLGTVGLLVILALSLFYNYGMLTEIDDLRK